MEYRLIPGRRAGVGDYEMNWHRELQEAVLAEVAAATQGEGLFGT